MTNLQPIFICPECGHSFKVIKKHYKTIMMQGRYGLEKQTIDCKGSLQPAYLASDLVKMLKERIQKRLDKDYDLLNYKEKIDRVMDILHDEQVRIELESLLREVEDGK